MPNHSPAFHAFEVDQLPTPFSTDPEKGLSPQEAKSRLKQHGYNSLPAPKKDPAWKKFLRQFQDFLIYILVAGIAFSFLAGEYIDGLVILFIVIGNAFLAFIQENKAERDLEEIKKISAPHCLVRRDGEVIEIAANQVVPGDILILETGDQVAADIRLIDVTKLEMDESSLTGESHYIKKSTVPLDAHTALAERANMCYKHTWVRYGRGEGVVVATGLKTEIGQIAQELLTTEETKTPLEKQLARLGKKLGIVALSLSSLIFLSNWILMEHSLVKSLVDSVSLAIAVVPEGLPAIVTICLAIGVQLMRKNKAIVRHLPAIETLGSTSYICTDKTGTITKGEMEAVSVYFDNELHGHRDKFDRKNSTFHHLMEVAISCNNATENSGSPTERALFMAAKSFHAKQIKKIDEYPFDSNRKAMSTIHKKGQSFSVFAKGSPEVIISKSTRMMVNGKVQTLTKEKKKELKESLSAMSSQGLRVLALAFKHKLKEPPANMEKAESSLIFLGFIGFKDPIRRSAIKAIKIIKEAGITPIMITGDQHETAFIIAKEAGILEPEVDIDQAVVHGNQLKKMTDIELRKICEKVQVYARVEPKDKVRIVKALQSLHHVVAMTGDGVNDSPAVKAADIGLAMGVRGTEVTKGTADIILTDDNYMTISSAVAQGRVILRNIKSFTAFLVSCNTAEIAIVFLALVMGLPLPFNARLLLWLNVVTDFLPALAMAHEPIRSGTMKRGPNPSGAPVIDRHMRIHILAQTLITSLVVMIVYIFFSRQSVAMGATAAFVTLAMAEVFRAFTARSHTLSLFKIGLFKNPVTNIGVITSTILVLILLYVPFLRTIFDTVMISPSILVRLMAVALLMPLVEEITKVLIRVFGVKAYRTTN